jgi:hypothetical protein
LRLSHLNSLAIECEQVQFLANLHRVDIPAATVAPDLDSASTTQRPAVPAPLGADKRNFPSLHVGNSFI